MTIKITEQRRMKINKVRKIRMYISKRAPTFSRLNMQLATINGVKFYGCRRDIRTLTKYRNQISLA